MNLKLIKIIDNGTLASERALFEVVEDDNLQFYILTDNTYTKDQEISNEWRHSYWMADQHVKKGDRVVLYTTTGTNKVEKLLTGNKRYIYYWNLGNCVWNNDGDAAVLFHLQGWKTIKVN